MNSLKWVGSWLCVRFTVPDFNFDTRKWKAMVVSQWARCPEPIVEDSNGLIAECKPTSELFPVQPHHTLFRCDEAVIVSPSAPVQGKVSRIFRSLTNRSPNIQVPADPIHGTVLHPRPGEWAPTRCEDSWIAAAARMVVPMRR